MTSAAPRTRQRIPLSATAEEVSDWLEGVTYKRNVRLDPERAYPNTVLVIRWTDVDSRGADDEAIVVTHRHALPARSVVGDRRAFIGWLRHTLGRVELHERDEWLLIDKRRIFDPHAEIDIR